MFIPTEEQKAIAEAVRRPAPANVGVNAGAGTGKTRTARYIITDCIPPHKSVLYCAFNRITADEFKEKIVEDNPNLKIYAKTFNGLGYSAMLNALGVKAPDITIRDDKYDRLAQDWAWANITQDGRTDEHRDEAARMLAKLVAMFMCNVTYGISGERDLGLYLGNDLETDEPILVPYDPADREALKTLVYKYDLFGLENPDDEALVIGAVPGLLEQGYQIMMDKAQRTVSFMEQVFWTVVKNWRVWQYDWVIVDEAQDLSPLERALVDKHIRPGGRLLFIGDNCQAIYAFKGADNNGFDNSLRFWGVNDALPLSISRRCPKAIAALVQDHKPGYRSTDDAPEGLIAEVTEEQMIKMLRPNDAVISRVRGPMIPLWRKLVKENIPAVILGSDIGKSITSIIKQVSRRKDFVYRDIHAKLKAHEMRKIENMIKRKKPEADIANYKDQMEAVYGAVDAVYERCANIESLIREIEAIFKNPEGDTKSTVKIMTGHGAKGLEFDRVFNLTPNRFPLDFPNMSQAAYIQELNLRYVVQTRTRGEYYLVVEKKKEIGLPAPELARLLDNQEQMTLFVQGLLSQPDAQN